MPDLDQATEVKKPIDLKVFHNTFHEITEGFLKLDKIAERRSSHILMTAGLTTLIFAFTMKAISIFFEIAGSELISEFDLALFIIGAIIFMSCSCALRIMDRMFARADEDRIFNRQLKAVDRAAEIARESSASGDRF